MTGRHVTHLVEQGQVVIRNDVAGDTRIPIPVPRATNIGATFDNTDRLDTDLTEPGGGEQSGETAADEEHLDRVIDGFTVGRRAVGVGVGFVAGEIPGQIGEVLRGALRPVRQAQISFGGEALLDRRVIVGHQ